MTIGSLDEKDVVGYDSFLWRHQRNLKIRPMARTCFRDGILLYTLSRKSTRLLGLDRLVSAAGFMLLSVGRVYLETVIIIGTKKGEIAMKTKTFTLSIASL